MRILVIGSGGREHALADKLAGSANTLFIAPGNGGTEQAGQNVPIKADEIEKLVEFAKNENIDLVIPGPELPLTLGITEKMEEAGIPCCGPDSWCAQLEGSKSFAKNIMEKAGVPTAKSKIFNNMNAAKEYAGSLSGKIVIKADGLAAGKGVIIANNSREAIEAIDRLAELGQAASTVLIEEFLEGEEVSLLCLCDGKTAVALPSAQDHKAVFDGDRGPNTGGMGAYSPAPVLPDCELDNMADIVIRPVLSQMAREGHPFKGILYAGLMMTKNGPKVLEYNVRFGDPECQAILPRMESDLASHLKACATGALAEETLRFTPKSCVGIVLAAQGYPESYSKNLKISGIEQANEMPNVRVYHSGTKRVENEILSNGGRVLCVTALANDLGAAQKGAYEALNRIQMPESHFRTDIAAKGMAKLKKPE